MLLPLLFAFLAFISTLLGGLTALRNRDRLHRVLGYTAGVMLGVIAFHLLPEMFEIASDQGLDTTWPMIAFVVGFLLIHIIEKLVVMHRATDSEYKEHSHPHVGQASALALIAHTFLDGVGIGLAFQAGEGVGFAVAIAVIAHDFSDGLNTVALMLSHKNNLRRSIVMLILAALAPILGALSTMFFTLDEGSLVLYLGFISGFLMYVATSDILPQAHSKQPSKITIGLTVLGVIFMFALTQLIGE